MCVGVAGAKSVMEIGY